MKKRLEFLPVAYGTHIGLTFSFGLRVGMAWLVASLCVASAAMLAQTLYGWAKDWWGVYRNGWY